MAWFARHSVIALVALCLGTACANDPPFPEPSAEGLAVRSIQNGVASWYGPGFDGQQTASGEIYRQNGYTAAHRTLPLRSLARVTRVETGESVVVRINDRGPYADGRVIDLSRAAAHELDFLDEGLTQVRVEALGPADDVDQAAQSQLTSGG
jgi:rare lipoprotein A